MRNYVSFLSILMVTLPNFALAQSTGPATLGSWEPSAAAAQQADGNISQNPAVILKPIRPDSKFDMALIDDVCVHTKRQVQVYRLKNAAVEEVANSINQWLKTKLNLKGAKVNGFICNAPVIIVPETATNSLIVSVAADFAEADQLKKIIQDLDRTPDTIEIQAVLKKTVNGETNVLMVPRLILKENNQGTVTLDTEEGQLTIELTARVIKDEGSRLEVLRSAQKETDNVKAK